MQQKKEKILVLSDLKKSTDSTLKSAISLAKMVDGSIHFFSVKKPLDIVDKESQLSAMRTINEKHNSISKEIKELVKNASLEHNINIKFSLVFGNIKSEIKDYIDSFKPDFIVLGKRKKSTFSLNKGDVTNYILKNFEGQILIADENKPLEPIKEFSLGLLNNPITSSNKKITDTLIESSKQPLMSFQISGDLNNEQEEILIDKKVIVYEFEKGDNAIKNVANYLAKNNINLLCVNRSKTRSNLSEIVDSINSSLIVTN